MRESAIERLNADWMPAKVQDEPPPAGLNWFWGMSKRNDALLNCVVFAASVALSTFYAPLDWRLGVGCLLSGIVLGAGMILKKKGYHYSALLALLVSVVLGIGAMRYFGYVGVMSRIQSMPLIGIGSFGLFYLFYKKFDLDS